MTNSKLSPQLINYLNKNHEANVEVVIELADPTHLLTSLQPGKSRIDQLKDAFFNLSNPIEHFINNNGGNVLGVAWINKTIKATIPASSLNDLAKQNNITNIDLPDVLKREVD
jgi:hypothetical protein